MYVHRSFKGKRYRSFQKGLGVNKLRARVDLLFIPQCCHCQFTLMRTFLIHCIKGISVKQQCNVFSIQGHFLSMYLRLAAMIHVGAISW